MRTFVPITVVIPTYNRQNVLTDTINSILAGKALPAEIIVVDQTPTPIQLPESIFSVGVNVRLIHEKIASLTHARNVGLEKSSNDIVLFCDDDILVDANTMEKLYASMKNENTALLTSISVGANAKSNAVKDILTRTVKTLAGRDKVWRKNGFVIKSSMLGLYAPNINTVQATDWAMGYFFCIKKSLCKKFNIYFDEKLTRYAFSEDLDFSYRYCSAVKAHGLKAIIDPSIYVRHLQSQEWRTPSKEFLFYYFANRRYLSYKLFPNKWWYRIGLNWSDFWKARTLSHAYGIDAQGIRKIVLTKDREIKQGNLEVIMK